jgi:hypothetical protein
LEGAWGGGGGTPGRVGAGCGTGRDTPGGAEQRAMIAGDRAGVDEFYLETLMTPMAEPAEA